MVGGGEKMKIVTNISVAMHKDFALLMKQLEQEAVAGAFTTKQAAIRRRDQLVATIPAATAAGTDLQAATAAATESEDLTATEAD